MTEEKRKLSDLIAQDNGLEFNNSLYLCVTDEKPEGCALANLYVSVMGMPTKNKLERDLLITPLLTDYPQLTKKVQVTETLFGPLAWLIEQLAWQSFSFKEVADKVRKMGY